MPMWKKSTPRPVRRRFRGIIWTTAGIPTIPLQRSCRAMLKGLGSLGDMGKLMRQAQEMQTKMAEVQEQLDTIEVEGEAGAGLVKAVASAKGELRRLSIDPSLFKPEEREVVEDLIVAAVKEATERAQARAQEEFAKVTEGLPLPPGMKLPF